MDCAGSWARSDLVSGAHMGLGCCMRLRDRVSVVHRGRRLLLVARCRVSVFRRDLESRLGLPLGLVIGEHRDPVLRRMRRLGRGIVFRRDLGSRLGLPLDLASVAHMDPGSESMRCRGLVTDVRMGRSVRSLCSRLPC